MGERWRPLSPQEARQWRPHITNMCIAFLCVPKWAVVVGENITHFPTGTGSTTLSTPSGDTPKEQPSSSATKKIQPDFPLELCRPTTNQCPDRQCESLACFAHRKCFAQATMDQNRGLLSMRRPIAARFCSTFRITVSSICWMALVKRKLPVPNVPPCSQITFSDSRSFDKISAHSAELSMLAQH